jgi:hypothetical protein
MYKDYFSPSTGILKASAIRPPLLCKTYKNDKKHKCNYLVFWE